MNLEFGKRFLLKVLNTVSWHTELTVCPFTRKLLFIKNLHCKLKDGLKSDNIDLLTSKPNNYYQNKYEKCLENCQSNSHIVGYKLRYGLCRGMDLLLEACWSQDFAKFLLTKLIKF